MDYRINNKHTLFGRYSHDGNTNSGPFGIPVPPSNFVSNENYVDQELFGLTSILSGTLVNDFRFSHMYWKNRNTPAGCEGSLSGNCIGAGGPEIFYLNSVNFALGNNFNSPQGRDLHRFPISNNTTWQKNTHQVKFGGEFEHVDAVGYWGFFDPARAYLLSPEFLTGVGVPPALFGLPDGIIHTPGRSQEAAGCDVPARHRRSRRSRRTTSMRPGATIDTICYIQDGWKVTPSFTLNYGLGWEHESNVLNYDLPKPAYLAPIYGSDLSATKKEYKNFAPAAGFAWSIGKDRPTVIRGGAGIFYDTQLGWWRLGERAVIGGSGRQFIGNAAVTNPAHRTAVQHRVPQFAGLQLRHVPGAAAGASGPAGRQVPGTGTTAADSPLQAGECARGAVPARFPDHPRAPFQRRFPA